MILSNRQRVVIALLGLVLAHCGDDSVGYGASPSSANDVSTTHDAAASNADAAAVGDAAVAADIPTLNGCAAADYLDKSGGTDGRTIQIALMGLTFTPKCMTIAKGQAVTWTGSLSSHPLAPGNAAHHDAGSPGSPIVVTNTGSSVTFTFPAAGTYPYYCQIHGVGNGEGMSGSIHVK